MAPYPVVPRDEVGFRLQLTAVNAQLTSAITSSGMSKLA
jgi:hypothetical protein